MNISRSSFRNFFVADQFDQDVVTAFRGVVNSQQVDRQDVKLFNLVSARSHDHRHAFAFFLGQVAFFGREILFDLGSRCAVASVVNVWKLVVAFL